MIHDDIGSGGGTRTDVVLEASPREGVPLLQQTLNLFKSGPCRGLGDGLRGFAIVASLRETAEKLTEVADQRL